MAPLGPVMPAPGKGGPLWPARIFGLVVVVVAGTVVGGGVVVVVGGGTTVAVVVVVVAGTVVVVEVVVVGVALSSLEGLLAPTEFRASTVK